jgi:CHAT domain
MSDNQPVKILMLRANPVNTDPLRLDEEVRGIQAELERSRYRDRFTFINEGAVRVDDLSRLLMKHKPDIVHFAGHGDGAKGLALEDNAGRTQLVATQALARLFQWARTTVKCVFLNACYSQEQSGAIHQHIDCVIGMNQAIGDRAAIDYAAKFYQALANGESFQSAYEYACTALDLSGSSESAIPELLNRNEKPDPLAIAAPTAPQTQQNSGDAEPLPRARQSQSFGNVTIGGSNNPFNAIQSGGNVSLNQTSTQSSGNNDLQAALDALTKLKQEVLATNALTAFAKKDTESKINMLQEELQKPKPDKSFVDEVVSALEQGLKGVVTLASPVTQVVTLVAKAWAGLL